jgi:hypothetical protein
LPQGIPTVIARTGARNGSAVMDQRKAFHPPLEQAPDPSSCFAAVVLVGGQCWCNRAAPLDSLSDKPRRAACGRSWPRGLSDLRPSCEHGELRWHSATLNGTRRPRLTQQPAQSRRCQAEPQDIYCPLVVAFGASRRMRTRAEQPARFGRARGHAGFTSPASRLRTAISAGDSFLTTDISEISASGLFAKCLAVASMALSGTAIATLKYWNDGAPATMMGGRHGASASLTSGFPGMVI